MILRSIKGHRLRKGSPVRLVYLDESGRANELHEPHLVVAGVIVDADKQWRKLEEFFAELTEEYFPKHEGHPVVFHAMDIWHGSRLFDRTKWPLQKRRKLLGRLARVPGQFSLPIVMGHAHRASTREAIQRDNADIRPKAIRAR